MRLGVLGGGQLGRMMIQEAMVRGQPDNGILPSGQVAGVIDDLPSVSTLMERIMSEANTRARQIASLSDEEETK